MGSKPTKALAVGNGHGLVSIVIPCYNAEEYVADAIRSALEQTYEHCEIIVVDDGSSDATLSAIGHFRAQVRIIACSHQGACAARNRGIHESNGRWIQFLDADDWLSPSKIKHQVALLMNLPRESISTCAWSNFSQSTGSVPEPPPKFWKDYSKGVDLLIDMWLVGGHYKPMCWLIPKAILRVSSLWDESLCADQDGDFFGRLLAKSSNVAFSDLSRGYYRLPGPNNVSSQMGIDACRDRLAAWDNVQRALLLNRGSGLARKAVLRRLRHISYSYLAEWPALLNTASRYERDHLLLDMDPYFKPIFRSILFFYGIETACMLRRFAYRFLSSLPLG